MTTLDVIAQMQEADDHLLRALEAIRHTAQGAPQDLAAIAARRAKLRIWDAHWQLKDAIERLNKLNVLGLEVKSGRG